MKHALSTFDNFEKKNNSHFNLRKNFCIANETLETSRGQDTPQDINCRVLRLFWETTFPLL